MGSDRLWEQQNLAPLELASLKRALESLAHRWYESGSTERNLCAKELRELLERTRAR